MGHPVSTLAVVEQNCSLTDLVARQTRSRQGAEEDAADLGRRPEPVEVVPLPEGGAVPASVPDVTHPVNDRKGPRKQLKTPGMGSLTSPIARGSEERLDFLLSAFLIISDMKS